MIRTLVIATLVALAVAIGSSVIQTDAHTPGNEAGCPYPASLPGGDAFLSGNGYGMCIYGWTFPEYCQGIVWDGNAGYWNFGWGAWVAHEYFWLHAPPGSPSWEFYGADAWWVYNDWFWNYKWNPHCGAAGY